MSRSDTAADPMLPSEAQEIVCAELALILASPPFEGSKRLRAMLGYCVTKTLSGDVQCLRERQLGVDLFGREPGYETSSDPVVRTVAGEVRKRLAQYYSSHANESNVRISLPVGGYTAEFRFPPRLEEVTRASNLAPAPAIVPEFQNLELSSLHAAVQEPTPAVAAVPDDGLEPRRKWLLGSGFGMAAICVLAVLVWARLHSPEHRFWTPLTADRSEIRVVIGESTAAPNDGMTAHPLGWEVQARTESIGMGDASAAIRLCSTLAARSVRCDPAYSRKIGLEDLRRAPVLLVGAFNNEWTLRAAASLRYRYDPTQRAIIDAHSQTTVGKVDFALPRASISEDYAIVARFRSDLTDSYVLLVGGIGPMGTEAAAAFCASADGVQELWQLDPKHGGSENVEVVLQTEIVNGQPGHTRVIASDFW